MSEWSLELGGVNLGTFATLGLTGLKRTLINQGVDRCTFSAPQNMDGTPVVAYGQTVSIKKDNAYWFTGRVTNIYGAATATDEQIFYELSGPWWYLEKIVYQQLWKIYSVSGAAITDQYMSRVILCQDEAGARITSGAQITAALAYAVTKGAPITVGTIEPAMLMPFDEQQDLRVSELIVRLLRWCPDAVCYFDYSTAVPTFNCKKRASLPSVTVAIANHDKATGMAITPRNDLLVPGVVLRFETTGEYDGQQYRTLSIDSAGTTTGFDALISTIELAGSRSVWIKQAVTVGSWATAAMDWKAFAKVYAPALKAIADADITVVSATRTGTLANYLMTGAILEWMPATSEADELVIILNLVIKDQGAPPVIVGELKNQRYAFKFTSTDAVSKTYRKMASFETGESVPTGMAAQLLASWSVLQYDGGIDLTEAECSANITPGSKLNITGGLASWASMNAQIQRVDEDVDNGGTHLTIGPARQLGPDALLDMLRAFRTRQSAGSAIARTTAKAEDVGGNVQMPAAAVRQDPGHVAAEQPKMICKLNQETPNEAYVSEIKVDPSLISKVGASVSIQPREITICENGVVRKMQIMCSEAYD